MDAIQMIGIAAGAIIALAGASRIIAAGFVRLVKASIADEMRKVWTELRDQDEWFHDQIREVKHELAGIHAQLRPNGGMSLRDSVDRLETLLRERG